MNFLQHNYKCGPDVFYLLEKVQKMTVPPIRSLYCLSTQQYIMQFWGGKQKISTFTHNIAKTTNYSVKSLNIQCFGQLLLINLFPGFKTLLHNAPKPCKLPNTRKHKNNHIIKENLNSYQYIPFKWEYIKFKWEFPNELILCGKIYKWQWYINSQSTTKS